MNYPGLKDLIIHALKEDIGHQDLTSSNLIPPEQAGKGVFIAKDYGVIAGLSVCQAVFSYLDKDSRFQVLIEDEFEVKPGDRVAVVEGSTLALLSGERVALNFLQRLSGIATRTRRLSELIKEQKAELLDTRKTTPGLRALEKYAVRVGGGRNHRFGLFDGVMIKDNHIKAAAG